jgi:hypothetical protein
MSTTLLLTTAGLPIPQFNSVGRWVGQTQGDLGSIRVVTHPNGPLGRYFGEDDQRHVGESKNSRAMT